MFLHEEIAASQDALEHRLAEVHVRDPLEWQLDAGLRDETASCDEPLVRQHVARDDPVGDGTRDQPDRAADDDDREEPFGPRPREDPEHESDEHDPEDEPRDRDQQELPVLPK